MTVIKLTFPQTWLKK